MSILYDNGNGIVGDEKLFHCPEVENHHKMGDYLRGGTKDNWFIKGQKPNMIIAGDAENNHNLDYYIFLFKDGHGKILKGKSKTEINDIYDKSITENSDPNRSWLGIRD
ncbi:MAG: hypothetical protein ACYTFY_05690 [Planctomycetota bacterium]|jgi:hypothetical protein